MKTVLREKVVTLSAFIKKVESSLTNKFTTHLKAVRYNESNTHEKIKQQEKIKLKAEINKIETKKINIHENQALRKSIQ